MKVSQLFTKTRKDAPADETAKNAQLLIKAGYIHKDMAGVYTYLPLGLRTLNKISNIIREEIDAIGGQEVLMPALQIKERYQATNRWDDDVVDVWFKTKLANGTELGLGFSHEENLTPIVKQHVASYKDLPLGVYQIQNKFRNELRSKSGIMRGREFLMKDLYTFAIDQAQHDDYYDKVRQAYIRIYQRLGIGDSTVVVLASGGSFSKYSHEFQTFSDAGEDHIFQTSDGQFYNREIAPSKIPKPNKHEAHQEYKEVLGKGVVGVQALLKFLNIPIEKSTKTLLFVTDANEFVIVCVRSDYDINELKLSEAIGCTSVRLATEQEVHKATGAQSGYAGIVNVPDGVRVFVDDSLKGLCNFETGANKTDYHAVNVNFGRDLPEPDAFYDIKLAKEGDLDPATNKPMQTRKAIEVGNIFSLGTKFTQAANLSIADSNGQEKLLIMGCYGIGVSRVMGTIAELMSDDKGLVWPQAIAPAGVYLAQIGIETDVAKHARQVYDTLRNHGIEVLYDDRDVRAGQKFADADLLGIPYRVVISDKLIKENKVELKARTAQKTEVISQKELLAKLSGGLV